jgi:type III restriction enzyme
LNQEKLIDDIAKAFNQLTITTKQSYIKQERLNPETNDVERVDSIPVEGDQIVFTVSDYLNFIKEVTQESKLPLPFTFGIKLLNLIDKSKILADRSKAKRELNKIIVDVIHSSMIQKVDYQFSSEVRITDLHDGDLSNYLTEIEYTKLGMNIIDDDQAPDNLLFDKIVWDSKIERDVQKENASKVNGGHITVFAKLPSIKIPTPYKTYSPDFAYLIEREGNKDLFLVVETKGYKSEQDIPVDEQNKIKYAERFFLQLQKELPDVQVEFKTRVNKQELIDLVGNIK